MKNNGFCKSRLQQVKQLALHFEGHFFKSIKSRLLDAMEKNQSFHQLTAATSRHMSVACCGPSDRKSWSPLSFRNSSGPLWGGNGSFSVRLNFMLPMRFVFHGVYSHTRWMKNDFQEFILFPKTCTSLIIAQNRPCDLATQVIHQRTAFGTWSVPWGHFSSGLSCTSLLSLSAMSILRISMFLLDFSISHLLVSFALVLFVGAMCCLSMLLGFSRTAARFVSCNLFSPFTVF